MPVYKKGDIVGMDACFREIVVGDVLRDADGAEYTADQFGRAKPLNGGNSVPLNKLKDPVVMIGEKVVDPVENPVHQAPAKPRRENPMKAAETPAAPVHASETGAIPREGAPAPAPAPAGTKKPRGNRTNKTGFVRLSNLTRKDPSLRVPDVRVKLAEAGIQVILIPGERNAGISVEDEARAREILGLPGHRQVLPKVSEASRIKETVLPDHGQALATSDPTRVFTKFDAFLILEDRDLADELRRRGYEVTCSKYIEL